MGAVRGISFSSVQFSRSVVSDSLHLRGHQVTKGNRGLAREGRRGAGAPESR